MKYLRISQSETFVFLANRFDMLFLCSTHKHGILRAPFRLRHTIRNLWIIGVYHLLKIHKCAQNPSPLQTDVFIRLVIPTSILFQIKSRSNILVSGCFCITTSFSVTIFTVLGVKKETRLVFFLWSIR